MDTVIGSGKFSRVAKYVSPTVEHLDLLIHAERMLRELSDERSKGRVEYAGKIETTSKLMTQAQRARMFHEAENLKKLIGKI